MRKKKKKGKRVFIIMPYRSKTTAGREEVNQLNNHHISVRPSLRTTREKRVFSIF